MSARAPSGAGSARAPSPVLPRRAANADCVAWPVRDASGVALVKSQTVAYVMNGFPRLSETFIANEIYRLEQMGLGLRLYSVKREREPTAHPVVEAIGAPLVYLPEATSVSGTTLPAWLAQNLPAFWRAHAAVAVRHPWRYLATLAAALALSWRLRMRREGARSFSLRKVFIKEFLQAGQIADALRRSPDVGHLHGHFCHGVATITWFASRLSGIPFSFTAHAKDIYQTDLNPGDLLERKLGAARFVATCTCANASVLCRRHPRPNEVHAIYHGLDTRYFAPGAAPDISAPDIAAPQASPAAPPLILAVGRCVEKKGFDHLIEACALLRQRGVEFGCLIVGERGSAYEAMHALIEARGLAGTVRLHGAVAQDALRDIYRSAHAFALPCQVMEDGDRDGFPNVLAEAMAMGVPVVSTDVSGIPEMIDDGVHGLLVEPRQVGALADALERVLTDGALHARLAHAGRARICERFDSSRTTLALRDLFVAQLLRRAEERTA